MPLDPIIAQNMVFPLCDFTFQHRPVLFVIKPRHSSFRDTLCFLQFQQHRWEESDFKWWSCLSHRGSLDHPLLPKSILNDCTVSLGANHWGHTAVLAASAVPMDFISCAFLRAKLCSLWYFSRCLCTLLLKLPDQWAHAGSGHSRWLPLVPCLSSC